MDNKTHTLTYTNHQEKLIQIAFNDNNLNCMIFSVFVKKINRTSHAAINNKPNLAD